MKTVHFLIFFLLLPVLLFAGTRPPERVTDASLVRVNSTNQNYDFIRPWQKKPPYQRRGLGAVLQGNAVLVTAELVANSTYLEIERAAGGEKCPARVEAIDYESNLALLRPLDEEFLKDARPLELDDSIRTGDRVDLVQLEANGRVATTVGEVSTIAVGNYPLDQIALLTFRVSASLQFRDGSFTLPAVFKGRLAGMVMRYDSRSNAGDLIPPPVIARFLEAAKQTPFERFPRAGFSFAPLRDPQLRQYTGTPKEAGGIYITCVLPGSPAKAAGLQPGDVLTRLGGRAIDADGNYDDPAYGRIALSHLTNTIFKNGENVSVDLYRDGKPLSLSMVLQPPDPALSISDNFSADQPPRYYILGGLIFEELSRAYLREWGPNWRKEAPQRLAYLDEFQKDLPQDRGKIVFLSQVLPSNLTLGYNDLAHLVVTKVNGTPIRRLEDLAEAVNHPEKGFHKIEFEEDPGVIYLDADLIKASEKDLLNQYQIPSPANLTVPVDL